MGEKKSNEITVKIKCDIDTFYKTVENKGFEIEHKFSMNDTFFIPETLNIDKMNTRDILSKAVLVREIIGKTSGKISKKITFKIKKFDEHGNILSQKSVNCDILEISDAKSLLNAMGYKEIMNIKENDIVYKKDDFEMAIKNIENGDNLIEIETNDKLDTIDKLIKEIKNIKLPIYEDNFFVKKAEIELDKALKRTIVN